MELTEEVRARRLNRVTDLKERTRWMFIAWMVQALGEGGQRMVEREIVLDPLLKLIRTFREGSHICVVLVVRDLFGNLSSLLTVRLLAQLITESAGEPTKRLCVIFCAG